MLLLMYWNQNWWILLYLDLTSSANLVFLKVYLTLQVSLKASSFGIERKFRISSGDLVIYSNLLKIHYNLIFPVSKSIIQKGALQAQSMPPVKNVCLFKFFFFKFSTAHSKTFLKKNTSTAMNFINILIFDDTIPVLECEEYHTFHCK